MPSKSSHNIITAPFAVTEACRALGERLAIARKRRRLTQRDVARRAGLSAFTLVRVERGVASTELGSIVRVLWALGMEDSLRQVASLEADRVGLALERARLPKRVARRKTGDDDDF